MQHGFGILAALFLATSATAQVVSTPIFTGAVSTSFEYYNTPGLTCIDPPLLSGEMDACGLTIDSVENGFSIASYVNCGAGTVSCTGLPRTGNRFFFATGDGTFTFDFHLPVTRIGAWFLHSKECNSIPDKFEFYGPNGQLLDTQIVTLPFDCTWNWVGWQTTGAPIHRIVWTSTATGFPPDIGLDDLQVDFISPSYCVSGLTSHGCMASITANANPSVGYAQPCVISVTGVEGQRSGTIFYGLTAGQQPWCTGSSSSLCVTIPVQRTPIQASGGFAGACNGTFTLDWNAYQLGTSGALGSPWLVGERAYVQAWFRDPPSCKGTALSNAFYLQYMP